MGKAFGINELIQHNFKHRAMSPLWQGHIGNIESNSTILIFGRPKNGKTDYCIKLCKELALHGAKVFYNSYEQGKSETLKEAIVRNNMQEVSGKVMFGDKEPFKELMERMKKPYSGNVLVIDSWDYMNLKQEDYVEMRNTLKRKMIIIICWANGDRADNAEAKKIEHCVDVLVKVSNYVAIPVSRYGGNERMKTKDATSINGQLQLL